MAALALRRALGFATLPHLSWSLLLATGFLHVLLTQVVEMWPLKKARI